MCDFGGKNEDMSIQKVFIFMKLILEDFKFQIYIILMVKVGVLKILLCIEYQVVKIFNCIFSLRVD